MNKAERTVKVVRQRPVAAGAQAKLCVLILEDNPIDAELLLAALRRSGFDPEFERVETEAAFRASLAKPFDLILSDYALPQFDGLRALKLVRSLGIDVPFILVSGSVGEETAVTAMREGADDYLLKDRITRLGDAVRQALERRRLRAGKEHAEAAARSSESRFRQLAESIDDVFFLFERSSRQFLYVSPAYERVFDLDRAALYADARAWRLAIHPDDRERVREMFETSIDAGGFEYDYRLVRRDGNVRWIRSHGHVVRGEGGADRVAGIAQDVTEQRAAEQKIRRLNRVYAMLSNINGLIVRARRRDELFHETCRVAVEHGGFPLAWVGEIEPDTKEIVRRAVAGDDADLGTLSIPDRADIRQGRNLIGRALHQKRVVFVNDIADPRIPDSPIRAKMLSRGYRSTIALPLVVKGAVRGVLALSSKERGAFDDDEVKLLEELAGDISFALDHIDKAEQLNYLAYYDELTGLANRDLFMERLKEKIEAARNAGRGLAVFAKNIDRFKTINDAFGRQAGDQLLRDLAERSKKISGDPTRLARIGADTFAIVSTAAQTEEDAARLVERRLHDVFDQPFRVGEQDLRLSAKWGIAMFPNDGGDAETLFRNAEAALTKAKAAGDRYLFFTPKLTERVAEQLALETKLRRAIENEEFVLHYQPKVDVRSRAIVGVEALIRWQSPELGLVPPLQFIPLLEETGMILDVGSWALRRASLDHRSWFEQKLRPPRVAVNVSAIQLRQKTFLGVVEQAIIDGLAPTGIDLEITESLVMEDIQASISKLHLVRGLGINVAVDDFGTGYSSLAYLSQLPVHSLKIDRSFVKDMESDANAATLVATIISLAHSLRLKVIAEGVETEAQAARLADLGCDEMQGYLISKPVAADALAALLRKQAQS
jgi:diguanylate cyclase (GGDEF)-like protein/PAS domain S-box-containing protein